MALPVISAAGIETAILPTAVLSIHTWFSPFTFHDLTDEIEPVFKNWQEHNITFDGISTGYLGSFRQIELVEQIFEQFNKPGVLKLVDPVIGDHGKFYVGFDPKFAARMAQLCNKADVIVPNLTEAAFMLNEEYRGRNYDEKYIRELLKRLSDLGCANVMLTGISYEKGKYGVASWNAEKDEYTTCFGEEMPGSFHGTGDIFSAALFAGLISGQSMAQAQETAVEFTVESIRMTLQNPDHALYGVEFERAIPTLLRKLGKI